uniref:(northern house mosquito) hypothetical protein n=1 Tax=Culex pipiens TaxID=7175 RepID=A0A8D8MFH4_CULPI
MDRGWKFGRVPAGDAAAVGRPRGREHYRVGPVAGAAHDDQVRHQQHPRSDWTEGGPEDGAGWTDLPDEPVSDTSFCFVFIEQEYGAFYALKITQKTFFFVIQR